MQMKEVALSVALVSSVIAQSSSTYRITQRYALGGDGSWDYIVPNRHIIDCSSRGRIASWSWTRRAASCLAR